MDLIFGYGNCAVSLEWFAIALVLYSAGCAFMEVLAPLLHRDAQVAALLTALAGLTICGLVATEMRMRSSGAGPSAARRFLLGTMLAMLQMQTYLLLWCALCI